MKNLSDEELIAHLRLQGLDKDVAAADRIEQLVKERDKFREVFNTSSTLLGETELQLEAEEAKLAKAVEAIQKMTEHEHCPYDVWKTGTDVVTELEKDT